MISKPPTMPIDACPCGDGGRPGHPEGWCGQPRYTGTTGPVRGLVQDQTALGLDLMLRANKAETELASARATLSEHVEENLTLHSRCNELEAALCDIVESSHARVLELEAEVKALEASHLATEELLRQETERRRTAEAKL